MGIKKYRSIKSCGSSAFKPPRDRGDAFDLERFRAQSGHVGGARARGRPRETAVLFGDLDVVDAGLTPAHQAVRVELPLLVAVGAMPLAARIMPLVLEAHRNAIIVESPEILDQAVVEFPLPFAGEEGLDRLASREEFRAVAPA